MERNSQTSYRHIQRNHRLAYLLIHPDIVNVVSERELRDIGLATIGAYSEVKEEVVFEAWDIVGEGVLRVAIVASIDSF